ncbi:MAG: MFS transporter [Armatimonadetes bacterium]|nr:MFS transporter [Armatimonadota bacterium]
MSQVQTQPCWQKRPVQNILIIALFAEIGYATLNLSTMPIYLAEDRHFGTSVIGLVMVTFLLFEAVFKSITGHIADKFGTRKLMIFGPTISIFTSLISIFLPHLDGAPVETLAFIVLRAFDGIAVAMLWPAAFAQMNDVVEDNERQHAMSYLNACYMIGIALAYPLGGIVNDLSGKRYAGIILASVLFAGAAFASQRVAHQTPPVKDEHSSGFQDFVDSLKQIPEYLILAVVTFMGIGFPLTIFKLFPVEEFHMSESLIGFMILPGALAMAGLSGTMAKVGERLGKVKAVHIGLSLCSAGTCVIALGAFLPFLRSPWFLALGGLPIGIGFLLTIPAWMASVSDINPEKRATNIGAVMTAQGVGAMIGAPIGATMYEKLQPLGQQIGLGASFGRYSPFVGCALCVLGGLALSLKILHEPKSSEALPNEYEADADAEVIDTVAVAYEEEPTAPPEPELDSPIIPYEETVQTRNDETLDSPTQ